MNPTRRAFAIPARSMCMIFPVTFGLGGCASFGAPGAVVPDRPGYTDTPVALPANSIQLETGVTDDRVGPVASRTEYVSAGETLLRFGIGANSEIRLFGNSYGVRVVDNAPRVSGMEDVKIGMKVNLRAIPDSEHSWAPNLALLAATTVPTGATALTAGSAQPEAKIAMNWTTASPFSLYANLGYGSIYNELGRNSRAWTSVAGWWSVNPSISLFAEGLTVAPVDGGGTGTAGKDVDAGVTYLINERFQLDIRAGRGFGSETGTERFVGFGLARRW